MQLYLGRAQMVSLKRNSLSKTHGIYACYTSKTKSFYDMNITDKEGCLPRHPYQLVPVHLF